MKHRQATRVHVLEVTMRELPQQHSVGDLPQHPFVEWNPTLRDDWRQIRGGCDDDDAARSERRTAAPYCGACQHARVSSRDPNASECTGAT